MFMIDTHCHLFDEAFDEDRDEAIKRAKEVGVKKIMIVGFSKEKDPDTFEMLDAKVLKEEGTIDAHRQMFVSDHFPLAVQFRQINPHQFSD